MLFSGIIKSEASRGLFSTWRRLGCRSQGSLWKRNW